MQMEWTVLRAKVCERTSCRVMRQVRNLHPPGHTGRNTLQHDLALPDRTPASQAETQPCALDELGFGIRTPAMFSKANLPASTLSSYLAESNMKITNFCQNPMLPRYLSTCEPASLKMIAQSFPRWHSSKSAGFTVSGQPRNLLEKVRQEAKSQETPWEAH